MSCHFLSVVILFLFYAQWGKAKSRRNKAIQWARWQNGIGNRFDKSTKRVYWHCAQCNLLLVWQRWERILSQIIIWHDTSRIFAFHWQVSVRKLSSDVSLSPSLESSVHEGSTGNDNDGSICGSDSAFYKQSEGKRWPVFYGSANGSFQPQV